MCVTYLFNRCDCPAGRTGDLCEEIVDTCLSNPCQNDGTCLHEGDRFVCQCSEVLSIRFDYLEFTLTHYQTTNFRLFKTKRVCRRQFRI